MKRKSGADECLPLYTNRAFRKARIFLGPDHVCISIA